jgi:homocysteine S-methyltransferase
MGVNCTPPGHVGELLRRMAAETNKPLLAYPNSGEQYDATVKRWGGATDCRSFAEQSREWYDAGARLLGGCCRTTPDDIRAIHSHYVPGGSGH